MLLFSVFITGCKKEDDFEGEIFGVCPEVTSDPVNLAKDVLANKVIVITFNTDMKASTINNSTFTIKQGTTQITGNITPTTNTKVFNFTPSVPLSGLTEYTGTVTTGARDTLNTAMAEDYVWKFTTQPKVTLSSNPLAGGVLTGENSYNIGSSVTVTASANPNFAFTNWTENNVVVSVSPNYQFTLNGNRTLRANFVAITAGNSAVNLSSSPAAGGTTVGAGSYATGSIVTVSASQNNNYNFVNWTENNVIVSTNSTYQFTLAGNRTLVANFVTAPAGSGIGPARINLGAAGNFVILTKAGITSVPTSAITGNIGTSPISGASIVGLTCAEVSGLIYTVTAAGPPCRTIDPILLTTAVDDMNTAFNVANGLVTPAPIVEQSSGILNGQTLAPGLYKWSTNVNITNEITLNGGANDTWVFQIAQNLVVNNSAKIKLTGGAQAKNIFWVVTGQAVLGTNVDFSGIILGKTLISLNTGAKVTGRLLAQTEVTLISSTVLQP